MDFIDEVRTLSGRFGDRLDYLATEEATKNALIMPFIRMLGYNVFEPTEVVPEFTADVGTRRGEKVDYALMQDSSPILLIEAKKYGSNLTETEMSQLLRYFTVTESHFGVLTDGISYRFFADLDQPNVMDPKPFFEFNMLDFNETEVEVLKQFTKSGFDVDETLEAAATLKYTKGMKLALARQLNSPDEEFTRWLARQVYSKSLTKSIRERFSVLSRQAFREFINDRINATLKTALDRETSGNDVVQNDVVLVDQTVQSPVASKIETTEEEIAGYEIVRSIVAGEVDTDRISVNDTVKYCGIILDGNSRQTLCRFRFNRAGHYLELISDKSEGERWVRHELETLDRIRDYSESILTTLSGYLNLNVNTQED